MSSSSSELQYLSTQNYGKVLFGDQITWYVHHDTSDTDPLAMFVFNPRTGQILLKVAGAAGQIGETAAEIASLMQSLPADEQPNRIIIPDTTSQAAVLDTLQIPFPNIVILKSQLRLPLQTCLKMDGLCDLIPEASSDPPRAVSFNIYDDWLDGGTPCSTAFSRLILFLRALEVDEEKAKILLETDIDEYPNHIWPSLRDENDWMKIEIVFRDLVLSDYANKNNIPNTGLLTQTQIRDVILGAAHQITPFPPPLDQDSNYIVISGKGRNFGRYFT